MVPPVLGDTPIVRRRSGPDIGDAPDVGTGFPQQRSGLNG
jgi:hypothetical protein